MDTRSRLHLNSVWALPVSLTEFTFCSLIKCKLNVNWNVLINNNTFQYFYYCTESTADIVNAQCGQTLHCIMGLAFPFFLQRNTKSCRTTCGLKQIEWHIFSVNPLGSQQSCVPAFRPIQIWPYFQIWPLFTFKNSPYLNDEQPV